MAMVYRRQNPAVRTRTARGEGGCRSAQSQAPQQQREGCWGEESSGEQEALRAVCPKLVQRDRRVLLKKSMCY